MCLYGNVVTWLCGYVGNLCMSSARDVVAGLSASNVTDPDSFDWISQLRYYYENDRIQVRMITTTVPYGYEYLGNTSRLVITPLTDRCYR